MILKIKWFKKLLDICGSWECAPFAAAVRINLVKKKKESKGGLNCKLNAQKKSVYHM